MPEVSGFFTDSTSLAEAPPSSTCGRDEELDAGDAVSDDDVGGKFDDKEEISAGGGGSCRGRNSG